MTGAEAALENPLDDLLVVTIREDWYALPVRRVREIVRQRPITPIPNLPDFVVGAISLRGEVIQVLDLRARLGLPALDPARRARPDRRRIVVMRAGEGALAGLLVDRVVEVWRVAESDLHPATARGSDSQWVSALCARGERFVSLLDTDRLLGTNRVA